MILPDIATIPARERPTPKQDSQTPLHQGGEAFRMMATVMQGLDTRDIQRVLPLGAPTDTASQFPLLTLF